MKSLEEVLKLIETYNDIELFYFDSFCGAGGESTGIEEAEINGKKVAKVVFCINHDKNAILSHDANHPDAYHAIEDIRTFDLSSAVLIVEKIRRLFPHAKVVFHASIECTDFSKAKGGQPRDADSRTLAEHLFPYIETINPDFIQIENVEEFMAWGDMDENGKPINMDKGRLYRRWVNNVKKYGYNFDHRILNAADYGAYTSRKRFFGIFAKKGLPIVFPEATHAKEAQHMLFGNLEKWKSVKEVLDFSDEGKSIFDRPCPLSPNTLERHKAGLIKFVAGGKEEYLKKRALLKLQTKISGHISGMKNIQFLSKYFSGHPESKNISILGPAHTIRTKDSHALISGDFCVSVEELAGTVTNNPKSGFITCNRWLMNTNFSNIGSSIHDPAPVITANRKWHYLVNLKYVATRECTPVINFSLKQEEYTPSFVKITSHEVIYEIYEDDLPVVKEIKEIMALYGIIDIKQRMLKISELKKIMGFPESYVLVGTQTEQKKFIGNAVEVNMARVLCEALYKGLKGLNVTINTSNENE